MSKVDDELTRRFHRAERPIDVDGMFEGLQRRRSHRERVRRIQVGALAVVVIAATVVGFVGLRAVFDETETDIGEPSGLPRNGEIVFSKRGDDGRFHLFAAKPDGSGERQITNQATNDTDPAVSPDGTTIAFVHELDQGIRVIATVPIEGGTVTRITVEEASAHDPSWSPDGTRLAYVGASVFEGSSVDDSVVYVIRLDRPDEEPLAHLHNVAIAFADPSWSPDGEELAVAARDLIRDGVAKHWVIAEIGLPDPRQPDLAFPTEVDERAPAWSPDGERIAFVRAGAEGDEIWTRSAEGASETLVARAVEASLEPDLAWAPDGTALLVSDGEWIYRVDATPEGDPRDNFVQLFRGSSGSWQPLPTGTEPPDPTTEPSDGPSPATGRDIGLAFPVCYVEQLSGIDWYGEGTVGAAWTGSRERPDGRCPREGAGDYVVAADLDGDGIAEPGGVGFIANCLLCRPYAAADLDGDGVLELVVLDEASSTQSYSFYEVSIPTSERSPGIYNLLVAPPGNPEGRVHPSKPLRIDSGGDEGYSSQIRCGDDADGRVLGWGWSLQPVDSDGRKEVHVLRIQLQADRLFHVIGVEDGTVPAGAPSGLAPLPLSSCGVLWNP